MRSSSTLRGVPDGDDLAFESHDERIAWDRFVVGALSDASSEPYMAVEIADDLIRERRARSDRLT